MSPIAIVARRILIAIGGLCSKAAAALRTRTTHDGVLEFHVNELIKNILTCLEMPSELYSTV
jgi:hypothetical protein